MLREGMAEDENSATLTEKSSGWANWAFRSARRATCTSTKDGKFRAIIQAARL
ncbi:MAG: hypothetical protein ACLUI3_03095 [Christensenellales bacterium]